MTQITDSLISFVIPVFNEAAGLTEFHDNLVKTCQSLNQPFEIIYCDDGSTDSTPQIIRNFIDKDDSVRLIRLSRNFGKEAALAAAIAQSRGEAIIMLDGDGQHPINLIPKLLEKWKNGAKVVIGVRTANYGEGNFKKYGSRVFYRLFNKIASQPLVPGSTDFRLIDREVQTAFLGLNENDRLTRGLIDWLGFERAYITFTAYPRKHGVAAYNRRKLIGLATNSFVSLTATPLYLFGYLGIIITSASFLLGLSIIIEQLLLQDPLNWNFTGTAMLGVLIIFLVGIVLLSQGIMAIYISHIHTQSKQRPLYVIDESASVGLHQSTKAR